MCVSNVALTSSCPSWGGGRADRLESYAHMANFGDSRFPCRFDFLVDSANDVRTKFCQNCLVRIQYFMLNRRTWWLQEASVCGPLFASGARENSWFSISVKIRKLCANRTFFESDFLFGLKSYILPTSDFLTDLNLESQLLHLDVGSSSTLALTDSSCDTRENVDAFPRLHLVNCAEYRPNVSTLALCFGTCPLSFEFVA